MAANIHAIFEASQIEVFLKRLEKKSGDIKRGSKELAGIISANVFRAIISNFESQQGPDGPWQAWSNAYREHMQKSGKGGNRILQDSGRLRGSLMPATGKVRASAEGIMFYSTSKYGKRHDEGTAGMPKRKFMWISDKNMNAIRDQALAWLADEGDDE